MTFTDSIFSTLWSSLWPDGGIMMAAIVAYGLVIILMPIGGR